MSRRIHAAIVGATGYGAGELLRLLTQHEATTVTSLVSESRAGASVGAAHSHLRGFYDIVLSEAIDFERLLDADHAVVFVGLPHGASADAVAALVAQIEQRGVQDEVRVIDLSGDFRLKDEDVHRRHYPGTDPRPELRERFVYGLPELFRESLVGARFIANPGCLATASILAGAPLVKAGATFLAIDAKTGSSGSGRALKETTHHPTRHADFRAYQPLAHRHEPEIRQALAQVSGNQPETSFVAHSMDAARGIFATVHAELPDGVDAEILRRTYEQQYGDCPFVRVVDGSPTLQDVVGSNFCDIGLAARGRQVIAMAALDNLVKGMAGAAIQNMNVCFGLDERMGLWSPSFRPV